MPEAPEVRHYADELATVLDGKKLVSLSARTKNARQWLLDHESELAGRKIQRVFAHGKNIVGLIDGGYYFYSHQMMWGRWNVRRGKDEVPVDRRERARITVSAASAVLMSAPIFEIGRGDPLDQSPLKELGPYVLPYDGQFDSAEFLKRLKQRANKARTIGDALLDQTIVAGLGNYLRAEVMFLAQVNPWTVVGRLTKDEVETLCRLVPSVSQQAYKKDGTTVTPQLKKRMTKDSSLVYVPGKEYGTRHYVFRRTNLPCLICSTAIKQSRQVTARRNDNAESEEEKSRIVYYCPSCQGVDVDAVPKVRAKARMK